MAKFDHVLLQQLRQHGKRLAEALPEGELNPRWLPRQLMHLEEFNKENYLASLEQDLDSLSRLDNTPLQELIGTRVVDKLLLLQKLLSQYQTLMDNAQRSHASFTAEQDSIYWVSNQGEKNLKLKLAKLKQTLKQLQHEIEQQQAQTGQTQALLNLLSRQGKLNQQIELMEQKLTERVDPLRQPDTYCLRSNPIAYTTFHPEPKAARSSPALAKQHLQALKALLTDKH